MGIAERVAASTTVAVVATTVAVSIATVIWLGTADMAAPVGLLAAQVMAGLLALVGMHLGMRATFIPRIRGIWDLARDVRKLAADRDFQRRLDPRSDIEVDTVAESVNLLLDRLAAERKGLAREASVGRQVLEASSVGVVLVGRDGRITYANPRFREMLDLRGEPVGRKPIESAPLAELQEATTAVLEGGEARDVEASHGPIDLVVQPTRLPDGTAMIVLRDVTGYREAQRARTDFVANVSHELRTPVSAIMGYAETLLADREQLPEDSAVLVDTLHRNAHRLADLFEDLLQLHRVEARRRELPLEVRPIKGILQEAVISAADNAAERGQSFSLECPDGLSARCNAEALTTMVSNLAHNAVSYTPEGGNIRVSARQEGDEVRVDVIDDGIGVDPVHHQRIFERFYRVDDARTRRRGTGLGLALVKHLALASNCLVTVDSASGKGSTFSIHLPRNGE